MTRIAIINESKCKPEKCNKECIKSCPPQQNGKIVIEIEDIGINIPLSNDYKTLTDKKKIARIAENLCIGCNRCVQVCPFNAITIINIPEEKKEDIIHRYNKNGFKLYRLPIMKKNKIIGIIGENGIGKTTLIEIICNKIRPNFGNFDEILSDKDIINRFKGKVTFDYFKYLYSNKLTFSIKTQKIKSNSNQNITTALFIRNELSIDLNINQTEFLEIIKDEYYEIFGIEKMLDIPVNKLSGCENQRLQFWITYKRNVDVYIFDEPTNFLDIKQRLLVGRMIKSLTDINKYVIVIEHDLSILDYVVDELYIVYGKPSVYGIISNPITPQEGINMYLSGFISTQNIRFREEEFNLKSSNMIDESKFLENQNNYNMIPYEEHQIQYSTENLEYTLNIPNDQFSLNNSIYVIMGENGTGKTTFLNYIANSSGINVSYKEQLLNIQKYRLSSGFYPTVRELLLNQIPKFYHDDLFRTDIMIPLNIRDIEDNFINELSGGELQKLLIVLCLGTDSDIYLLDEPSANLDIDKRLKVIKIIKKYVSNYNKTIFIIEHDIMMCVSLSQEFNSKIILVKQHLDLDLKEETGKLIKSCSVSNTMNFNEGINGFLKELDITMRLSNNNRPRINKYNSQLDKEQRNSQNYYGISK